MCTDVKEADLNRDSSNPLDAFAPMTEDKLQEFHQALEAGFKPVPLTSEDDNPGMRFEFSLKNEPLTEEEELRRDRLRSVFEAELEQCGRIPHVVIHDNGGMRMSTLEHEMRAAAVKQLETDPDGDGPPVIGQVIRAAYQDENPPKEALKKILLAGLKPMSLILKEMVAKAKDRGRHAPVIKVVDTALGQYVDIEYSAPSESREPLKILNPQIAQRHPEWAGAVLDGLETIETEFPEFAFFYPLAVLTGATTRDLADLFDTPLALVLDEMDHAHAILLRIIGERARVGVPS
jgi:hypothetical protein